MRYSKPKDINKIFNTSNIGHILHKSQFVDDISLQINKILPKTFQGYYAVKNYDGNKLVIVVANGTIRYGFLSKQQELLTEIQKQYPEIDQLQLSIDPSLSY